jgi:medium-chain acyl-[acyl-carrier-protein] hydrolase
VNASRAPNGVSANRWIAGTKRNDEALVRLFCFPYSGGTALVFRGWAARLPATVDVCPVQLPGRGPRLAEAPRTNLGSLVADAAEGITPYLDRPFCLYGHSLGALVAFELARRLRRLGKPAVHLFASGHGAPGRPYREGDIHDLSDELFTAAITRMGGTPTEVLENRELMEILLPVLRADFTVCETYAPSDEPPLSSGITVFGGLDDPLTTREDLEAWRKETTGSFSLALLPGNHFFLHTAEDLLLDRLGRELEVIARKSVFGGVSSS